MHGLRHRELGYLATLGHAGDPKSGLVSWGAVCRHALRDCFVRAACFQFFPAEAD